MRSESQRGLTIVYTGEGKGKTTAALGLVLRAWGRNFRICVIQFLKSETGRWGEVEAARKIEVEWHILGQGFTREDDDQRVNLELAHQAWRFAQQKISSNSFDLIILDEFTYPLHYGWLDTGAVLEWLENQKPPPLHLVITGRSAPPALIKAADLVTEMKKIKHPFDQGIKGQPGIDF
jgi:cob(I)alamin adenosyltransferase